MQIKIGQVAKELREALGLSQKDAADALGITNVHLSNIENDKAAPSVTLLDRYHELWGIDLYVFAWSQRGDVSKLPPAVQRAASELSRIWSTRIESLLPK